jgi:hypothetical protein
VLFRSDPDIPILKEAKAEHAKLQVSAPKLPGLEILLGVLGVKRVENRVTN